MRASTNNGSGSVGAETFAGTSANDCRVSAGFTRFSLGRLTGGRSLRPGRWTETRTSDTRRFVGEVDAFFGFDFTARRMRVVAADAFPLRSGLVRDAARLEPAEVVAFLVFFAAGFLDWPRVFAPTTFPTARFDEDVPWDLDFRAVDFEETGFRDDFILLQYRPRERSSLFTHRTRCAVRRRGPPPVAGLEPKRGSREARRQRGSRLLPRVSPRDLGGAVFEPRSASPEMIGREFQHWKSANENPFNRD